MKIAKIIYNPLNEGDTELLNVINIPEDKLRPYHLKSLTGSGWVPAQQLDNEDLIYLNLDHPVDKYGLVAKHLYGFFQDESLKKFMGKV